MSGHSKWATIKRKKGALDAKRGRIFTKLIRELMVASRAGGSDPSGNPRLRLAIDTARSQNMPNDNIERAIKKGAGELEGATYEEVTYEGYGVSGVAILIEVMTDNKNRTVAEVRNILNKNGGSMAETGSVSWVFERKGVLHLERAKATEEQLMEIALDAGADDIEDQGEVWSLTTPKESFTAVKDALEKAKLPLTHSELAMVPKNTVALGEVEAAKMLKLMEAIEDCDDVQHVYANFDIPDEIMEKVS